MNSDNISRTEIHVQWPHISVINRQQEVSTLDDTNNDYDEQTVKVSKVMSQCVRT